MDHFSWAKVDSSAWPDASLTGLYPNDVHLSKQDGQQIFETLSSATRLSAQIQAILIASLPVPWDRHAAGKHPVLHFLTKPASLRKFMQLGAVVRDLLTKRSLLTAGARGCGAA
jgi:hypothetical protein